MHVVVIGAGAVGGYFGGRLAQHGRKVTFLVRPNRLDQLQQRGLRVNSPYGDFQLNPGFALRAEDIEHPDLVMVCVKNYHLQPVLATVETLAKQGAYVLPLLNGMAHMDALRQVVPEERLLGGTCHIEATLNSDGDVVHTGNLHDITFGGLGQTPGKVLQDIEQTFADCGFRSRHSTHVIVDMWQKFIFLATFSGLTSAVRQPIGTIREDAAAMTVFTNFLQEAVHIARAECPDVPNDAADAALARVSKLPAAMTASMHRDLEKGLPLELESLQGEFLHRAEKHHFDAPTISLVYSLLHPYRNGAPAH